MADVLNVQSRIDRALSTLSTRGFTPQSVSLVHETVAGANAAKGDDGTSTSTRTLLDPQPYVDLRDQFRTIGGAQNFVGNALMIVSLTAATRAQIEDATWVEVNGKRYTVVAGIGATGAGIKEIPFTLEVILSREQQP